MMANQASSRNGEARRISRGQQGRALAVQDINAAAREALEQQTDRIIARMAPTNFSEMIRNAVFSYMRQIILDCFSDEQVLS